MAHDAELDNVKIWKQFDLQNAAFLNSDGNDISTQLADLDSIATAEFGYIDDLTPGTVTASKALVVGASKQIAALGVTGIGTFASLLKGSGIPLSSTVTGALKVYSDDAGASIATSCRGIQSRVLLTVDQTGGSIRSIQGQVKLCDGVDVTSGIYTGVQGYVELAGDTSAKTGSTLSCVDVSLEIASGKALTIDSGGEACGIHVETTGSGTFSDSGTLAAILVSNASGAPDWTVGLNLTASCTTGINIGVCTGGIVMTGVTGYALDIATSGVIRMGVQDTGVDLTTTYPFAIDVQCEANADIVAGDTGSSAGVYVRYAIETAQTSNTAHIGMFGKLRVKADLADGNHAGVMGWVEISGTTELGGIAATTTAAGSFSLIAPSTLDLSTGHLNGIVIDSSVDSSATITGTMSGIRIKKSTGKLAWPTGIAIEASACTTGMTIGVCTTGIAITGATGYALDIATSGVMRMGVQGTGVHLSTTYPFAMEVQCETNADISGGSVGATAGIYSRYEINVDQTTNCSHISMFAKLRVKKDLGDGSHAGVYGYVEISETGTVIGGTSTTTTAAGHFAIETDTNFELSTGHLNGVCIDSSVHASATITGTMSGIRIKKSTSKLAWPVGIAIEASACTAGITLGTMSGTGLDFPAGSTYGKAIAVGTFNTPIVYTADELIEIHGQVDAVDASKPMTRFRNSAYASGAMTTGAVTTVQCQAYNVTTNNVGQLCALEAHVGVKGTSTVLADAVASLPNMRAAWFKIEDLGNDLTLTGSAACVVLGKQFNTGSTLTGDSAYIWLLSQGNVGYNLNAIIEGKDGTGSGLATYLLDIPAALPYSAANSGGTQSGKIALNVGGATKYVQCYSN